MRGCLTFVLLLVAIAAIAGWILLPSVAGVIIADRLENAGFRGTDTRVTVAADPPLELATLHASSIHVTSTDARFEALSVGRVDVTLSDVDLLARTAADITGVLTDLQLESGVGTTWTVSSALVSGSSSDARIALELTADDARLMASGAIEKRLGSRPTTITFAAPDRIQFVANGTAAGGRLIADDQGRLVFEPGGAAGSLIGSIYLLSPGADIPLRVNSVQVSADGITVAGSVDASLLGH